MTVWQSLPKDVIDYFRKAFRSANRQVTELVLNVPNIRETSLDDCLINALIPLSPPNKLPSGAVVQMDIHNIGGLRRASTWETADIAVLVFIYRGTKMVAQKIGLLQSKRLYPLNGDVMDEDADGFRYGMNSMILRSPTTPLGSLSRRFEFTQDCLYSAIHSHDHQISTIDEHNKEFGESIYYLLYTPPMLPSVTDYPVVVRQKVTKLIQGCLVVSATPVHAVLDTLQKGASPSHRQIVHAAKSANINKLERWAADLLLRCKVGQPFDHSRDELVSRMLLRRSGPIGAAIAISVALPRGD